MEVPEAGDKVSGRAEWLKTHAKKFLQEVDELEGKGDANASEDTANKGGKIKTKSENEKKRKRQSSTKETLDIPAEEVETEKASKTKDGKSKDKGKGKDATRDSNTSGAPDKNNAPNADSAAERWNVNALGGGSERQSKFMKLLGGGNAAPSASSGARNSGGSSSKLDVNKVQDDLQRQYEAGMRMKFEGQGQRKGLGG